MSKADEQFVKVVDIHEAIFRLFAVRKYPWLTHRLPIDRMGEWARLQAGRLRIDEEMFGQRVRTVFWAVAHVQMSLGHALIARQSVAFPNGRKVMGYEQDNLPTVLDIPDQYFWYYAYMTAECLYRCWERLTSMLQAACLPTCTDKLYFDQLVNKIQGDERLSINSAMNRLLRQRACWNRVCGDRNRLSHRESSPSIELDIVGQESRIYGPDGTPAVRLELSYSSIDGELDKLKNRYKALVPAIQAVQEFIEKM